MNKNLIIVALAVVILLGAGGFWYYNRSNSTSTTTACVPAEGETAFSGKVVYVDQYKQYTLQSANGVTYYLRTTDNQASQLQAKVGKNAQVNGTLVTPDSSDVIVKTVCP